MLRRRDVLAAGLLLPLAPRLVLASDDAERLLREGGVVIAFRHALAPGTFDLAMVFLISFVLYYFINWKYLSQVWGLS